MAIDDGGQVSPAVISTGDVGDIYGPALIRARSDGDAALDPWAGSRAALMTEPPLGAKDAVDRLLVHKKTVPEAKESPQTPISVGGVLGDELPDTLHQEGIERPAGVSHLGRDVLSRNGRSGHFKHAADATDGDLKA